MTSHLRIWKSKRTGDLYFAGKIAVADVGVEWLEFKPEFRWGISFPAEAISQAEGLKQAFQVATLLREEAQKHDGSGTRSRA